MASDVGDRVALFQIKVFSKKKRSSFVSLTFVLIVAMLIQPKLAAQTDGPLMVTIRFLYCTKFQTEHLNSRHIWNFLDVWQP